MIINLCIIEVYAAKVPTYAYEYIAVGLHTQ